MGHTHTDIGLYIYRFMYRYTGLPHKTCTDELRSFQTSCLKQGLNCDSLNYTPDPRHTDQSQIRFLGVPSPPS